MIEVTGYDTSLPEDDIKSALTNHFSSCGEIEDLTIRAPTLASSSNSGCEYYMFIYILGEGAEEKALQLNGSDMGGCKLVVKACYKPLKEIPRNEFVIGYTIYPGNIDLFFILIDFLVTK